MNMRFVQTAFKDTPGAAAAMKRVRALMEERLAAKPELRDVLIPEWNVGCRRRESILDNVHPSVISDLMSDLFHSYTRYRLSRSFVR